MDCTLNIVSKCRFSLYLNIRGLQKGPGKFFMGVLESPGKVLDFFVSKRVGTVYGDTERKDVKTSCTAEDY